ncbi:hypothetical protein BELL_0215g00010 [Botrytis elliptica]|uniref:Uncharacterized protein n=1 Tax=Botrytis elliptica TaxID=278938 RepID=A0A4Z1K1Y2_9HELO|nr:hypothetical protein EAE99_001102 [Botrytis elliptica]TGO75393.1 hypothetical protein BELL_0215g00010 [Botrytis elliptica]
MQENISTAPRRGRPISVREYLQTKQGQRWLTDMKSHKTRPNGSKTLSPLGDVGTAWDVIAWVQRIAGGGSKNVTPKDLAKLGDEIIRAIRESQEQMQGQIGEIGDTVRKLPGQIDDLENLVKEMREAEESGDKKRHEQIVRQLDIILDEQRRNTLRIIDNINVVGENVTRMWNDMNEQFGEMMKQLSQITNMLVDIAGQISEILAAVQKAVEGIEEIKKKVDFTTIIGMINEHQSRIMYAIDIAYDITITSIENPSSSSDEDPEEPSTIQVNTEELLEWARKTVDLTNGLPYHLYCFHRVLIGDNLLGKSFFASYFELLIPYRETFGPTVARIVTNLVAFQAQGFGVLDKARQILELPALDYSQTIKSRVEEQLRSATFQLEEKFQFDELDLIRYDGRPEIVSISTEYKVHSNEECLYWTVTNASSALSTVDLSTNTTCEFGLIVPGQPKLRSILSVKLYMPGNEDPFDFGWVWPFQRDGDTSSFDAKAIKIDPQFAMVGLQFLPDKGEQIGRIVPMVSPVDEVTGRTRWHGVGGEIYLAQQSPEPATMQGHALGDGLGISGYIMDEAWRGGRMTGLKMVHWKNDGGETERVLLSSLSTRWEGDTWLPSQIVPSAEVTYTPVTLPIPREQRLTAKDVQRIISAQPTAKVYD